jgi:hypothetical protein
MTTAIALQRPRRRGRVEGGEEGERDMRDMVLSGSCDGDGDGKSKGRTVESGMAVLR